MPSIDLRLAASALASGRHAEARHAGVDMDPGEQRAADLSGMARPALHLAGVVQNGDDVLRDVALLLALEEPVEHEDARLRGHDVAQRQRLAEMRDEEAPAAGLAERLRDLRRAEAVGVGLQDRAALATLREPPAKAVPVACHCGEVDLKCRLGSRYRFDAHRVQLPSLWKSPPPARLSNLV